jgi:hypothetical protein
MSGGSQFVTELEFIAPEIKDFLASLGEASTDQNDVSMLTANIFLTPGSVEPYAPTAMKNARDAVSSIGQSAVAAAPIPPPVSLTIANLIYEELAGAGSKNLNGIGSAASSAAATDKRISDAIYLAGREAFLALVVSRLNLGGAAYSRTSKVDISGGDGVTDAPKQMTLVDIIDYLKDTILAKRMPTAKTDGKYRSYMSAATLLVTNAIAQLGFEDASVRNFIFGPPTVAGLMEFGLGPWLTLQYIHGFSVDKNQGYIAQVYARYAMCAVAASAVKKLAAKAYPSTVDADQTAKSNALINVSNKLTSAITNFSTPDATQGIQAIMRQSNQIAASAKQLNTTNAHLSSRLGIARDLDTTFRVDRDAVARRRATFYAWTVAFVSVLAASVFLVATGRLPAFMALAGATVSVVTAYFFVQLGIYLLFGGPSTTRPPTLFNAYNSP